MKLGEILLQNKLVTPDQLNEALEIQAKQPDRKLGEILIELGYINTEVLQNTLQNQ